MTDLESPRKNNDCYFYYYSTCAKGDNCTFRHEPSALGCETMCSFWKEGKCVNVHCNFRHMELRKNRKVIPCYWESQPGGCLKPHCPFMHQTAKPSSADESLESKTDSGTESADNTMHEKLSDKSFKKAPVDSLVVNFEEESDNESGPANSPVKASHRVVKVKTLEEIKLEKIQAESAAYYSFPEAEKYSPQTPHDAADLRRRILDRFTTKTDPNPKKRPIEENLGLTLETSTRFKKFKNDDKDMKEIKIKTLEEIRAERASKSNVNVENKRTIDVCDSSVTSTCDIVMDSSEIVQNRPKRKVKLQRKPSYFVRRYEDEEKNKEPITGSLEEDVTGSDNDNSYPTNERLEDSIKSTIENDSSKTIIDEVLLLQDDDDSSDVSLKEEDELLNDSDDML